MSKTLTISDEAANCLAYFAGHEMYGPTISSAIIELTKEWFCREHRNKEMCINSEFEYLKEEQKQ